MSAYSIAAAKPGDVKTILAFLKDAYSAWYESQYPREFIEEFVPPLVLHNAMTDSLGPSFNVVRSRDDIVGCGGWSFEDSLATPIDARVGHIRFFATSPEHTRRGIARMIFEKVVEEAERHAVSTLKCLATLPASRSYQALGFRRVGAMNFRLGSGAAFPLARMEFACAQSCRRAANGQGIDP
ncbi:MAG: GNAT family N-acetyltransferase [Pseudomonadota bacterium]